MDQKEASVQSRQRHGMLLVHAGTDAETSSHQCSDSATTRPDRGHGHTHILSYSPWQFKFSPLVSSSSHSQSQIGEQSSFTRKRNTARSTGFCYSLNRYLFFLRATGTMVDGWGIYLSIHLPW